MIPFHMYNEGRNEMIPLQEAVTMDLRSIMKRAHEIARTLVGHYHARLAYGLRIAWAEAKTASKVRIEVRHQPSGGREWVAEIIGRHPRWKFEREFLTPVDRRWSYSGRTGKTIFELEEGKLYEVHEPWKGRRFVKVEGGQVVKIDVDEVLAYVENLEKAS